MKALTVWQPWATLIAISAKPFEFRGYPAARAFRHQRIAIHAGKRPPRRSEIERLVLQLRGDEAWETGLIRELALPLLEKALLSPGSLPTSAIVATAVLGKPRRDAELLTQFGGPVLDSDRLEHSNWGWPLSDVIELQPPVPATGAQGFWEWRE